MTKTSTASKVATGLGVAALAAGAAAAYYLTGEGGKTHRKEVKEWAKKAKSEIAQKVKGMEKLSRSTYDEVVKEVMAKYKQVKNVDPIELADFGKELKGHWDNISKHAMTLVNKKQVSPKTVTAKVKTASKPKRK